MRRDALRRYRDYVQGGADFPLVEFRSRHSAATQAVGYGKALMLFHMLRRELGDDVFVRGLRDLYREQRFRSCGLERPRGGIRGRGQAAISAASSRSEPGGAARRSWCSAGSKCSSVAAVGSVCS